MVTGIEDRKRTEIVGYVAPIVVFGVFTAAEGYLPASLYPLVYTVKIAAVIAALIIWRSALGDIRPCWRVVPLSVLVGLAVFVAWLAIDENLPYPHLGARTGFDPFALQSAWTSIFLAVRLAGLVLVVPVMEEIFWRSFVLRWATNADFRSVAIGVFSPFAFILMVAGSAIAHPEWLVAAIASSAYGLWLGRTRSLFAVIVAHGVTNAALGAYILATHDWKYW